MKWLLSIMLFASMSYAADTATRPFTMAIVDTSSTNITTGYDGAGAMVMSGLASPRNILVWNETELNIGVSLPTGTTCVVSSPDHLIAPGILGAASGVSADKIAIGQVVCLRSLSGGTISTGDVYVSVW